MIRFAPRLMVLLLCGTTLAACASTTPDIAKATGGRTAAQAQKAQLEDLGKNPSDLEGSVRQAQLLRSTGRYDEAVHILSQLMLVASDDPRVVGEYGKTLAQEGRASEAVQFLSRATELSPTDWTIYSAMGVSYDQLGDQNAARTAYERALVLRPGEPSVLNNYALSRMLANDPDNARQLIARAQGAGGASDPKIARNIALVNQLAPAPEPAAMAAQRPNPMQQQAIMVPAPPVNNIMPTAAPRPLVNQQNLASIQRQTPQNPAPQYYAPANTVVMQRVPVDPLAGPVAPRPVAVHAPRPLMPLAKATTKTDTDTAKSDAAKPDMTKPLTAKTAEAKPAPVKVADAKPAPAKTADAKAAASGPSARIDIKPEPKTVKTAINAVPALRMAADKY